MSAATSRDLQVLEELSQGSTVEVTWVAEAPRIFPELYHWIEDERVSCPDHFDRGVIYAIADAKQWGGYSRSFRLMLDPAVGSAFRRVFGPHIERVRVFPA